MNNHLTRVPAKIDRPRVDTVSQSEVTTRATAARHAPALADDGNVSQQPSVTPGDVDWVIVGSGFGGSVPALRLAEKGYDVLVLEQGRRFDDADFAKTARELGRLVWAPRFGLKGIMAITPLKHVSVISGVGVGGGSLVYGNTLYVPTANEFFKHPQWGELADWRAALAPHYATAQRMLGVTTYVADGPSEAMMRQIAAEFGVPDSFHPTEVGVFLGTPGRKVPDPYFYGQGPDRSGCIRCGQCMLGCRHNAKNTLVKNYLHLAQRLGARVEAERRVVDIRPLGAVDGSDGYAVTTVRTGRWFRRDQRTVHTNGVIVAAGPLGTTRLLRSLKDSGALPRLSDRIGDLVRTNSEAIVASTARGRDLDWGTDIAITSSVHPDGHTHFTNNTYGAGGDLMGLLFGPMTGATSRRWQLLRAVLVHPLVWLRPGRLNGWSKRSVIFTVMQSLDSSLQLRPSRFTKRLNTEIADGTPPARHLPIANRVASLAAQIMGGDPQSSVLESVMGTSTTAHILGGAVIGASPDHGVVDRYRRAFGYQNLLVTDGSTLPANVGVNPSLTITAMAEEAMTHIPRKSPSETVASRHATTTPTATMTDPVLDRGHDTATPTAPVGSPLSSSHRPRHRHHPRHPPLERTDRCQPDRHRPLSTTSHAPRPTQRSRPKQHPADHPRAGPTAAGAA